MCVCVCVCVYVCVCVCVCACVTFCISGESPHINGVGVFQETQTVILDKLLSIFGLHIIVLQ